jgi:hypothetical protein
MYGSPNQSMGYKFCVQGIFVIFQKVNSRWNFSKQPSSINSRWHGSHVNLEAIKQVQQFGLDMITLPSHTSHALQPLDVNCFKPFKITFGK